MAEASRQPADEGLGEVEDPLGNAAFFHDRPDQNEKRYCNQQERVHRREHGLRQKIERHRGEDEQRGDPGQTERDRQRHAQHAHRKEDEEEKRLMLMTNVLRSC